MTYVRDVWDRKPVPTFVLKTPPILEPIGLDEVKAHSRIVIDDDDLLIQSQILAVRRMVEQVYDLAIMTQTWTMYLDWLPDCIEIFKRPVQSITSVKYLDADGLLQTLSSQSYYTDLNARPPRIVSRIDAPWPYVEHRPSAIAVEFVAGYGSERSDVPPQVIQYLLMKTADYYEYRESYTEAKINGLDFVDNLMSNERLFST